ncbi:hypothetical protein BvCmsHHP033_01015 [Escherichia coli]|nr:hypothetical protein BvCmsHHP033_01015 [Escherichia coli]
MLQDYYLYFLQDFYRYLKKIHQHNRHDYLHREYDKQQLYLYLDLPLYFQTSVIT